MKEEVKVLTVYESSILTMLSAEILNGKRKHELVLIDLLVQNGKVNYDEYVNHLTEAKCRTDEATLNSVHRVFDLSFFTKSDKKKYGEKPIIGLQKDKVYRFNSSIQQSLNTNEYFKHLVMDTIGSAFKKNEKYQCVKPLTLYEKYSRKDACKLLNWQKDESSTMYGYKPKHQTCPIFVTYHKNDKVEASVDYGDEFLSPEVLRWYSRSNRTLKSDEVQKIINAEENGYGVHFFMKKDDDEGSGFYYLGQGNTDKKSVQQNTMEDKKGKEIPVVHMNMVMEQSIDNKLYHYIVNGVDG